MSARPAPDAAFDDLVRLTAAQLDVPVAAINLVEPAGQWTYAAVGMEHGDTAPTEASFCARAVLTPDTAMVVPDATADPRFADNPFVRDGLRFYAGMPLVVDEDAHAIGTLCVADTVPRELAAADLETLRVLARAVTAHLTTQRRSAELEDARAELAAVLEHAPDAFVAMDRTGAITGWNRRAEAMFGHAAAEVVGRPVADVLVPPELAGAHTAGVARHVATGRDHVIGQTLELEAMRHDGSRLPIELTLAAVGDRYNAFARDVSARRRTHDALRAAVEGARRLARATDAGQVHRELAAAALAAAGAHAVTLWERGADDAPARVAAGAGDPAGVPAGADAVLEVARTRRPADVPGAPALLLPVVADGTAAAVLAVAWAPGTAAPGDEVRDLLELLAADAGVALERSALVTRLDVLSRTDELTRLANRRTLRAELPRELARARRRGEPVSVAMLDLDRFKQFNDGRGHAAGDELLARTAAEWTAAVRVTDVLARYGGEEFALVLPACPQGEALALVERLRAAVPLGQTCSAGVAEWDGTEDADALLARADLALYAAKHAGRDRALLAA